MGLSKKWKWAIWLVIGLIVLLLIYLIFFTGTGGEDIILNLENVGAPASPTLE